MAISFAETAQSCRLFEAVCPSNSSQFSAWLVYYDGVAASGTSSFVATTHQKQEDMNMQEGRPPGWDTPWDNTAHSVCFCWYRQLRQWGWKIDTNGNDSSFSESSPHPSYDILGIRMRMTCFQMYQNQDATSLIPSLLILAAHLHQNRTWCLCSIPCLCIW